jgi:hypothetical protein
VLEPPRQRSSWLMVTPRRDVSRSVAGDLSQCDCPPFHRPRPSTRCDRHTTRKRRREVDRAAALQSFRPRWLPPDVTVQGRPLGIRCSCRVPGPSKYRSYWFRDPTMPLAVSSAAWFFFAGLRRSQLSDRCALSSSFAFLQSVSQRVLASRPQSASTSLGLSFPTALMGAEVYFSRACQHPLRSGFRVWLPSGRLSPSAPLPALFRAGSALGIRPAELSPLGRYPSRFRGDAPTCRFARQ